MLVHLFGGVWSPSCAAYALRKTAMDNTYKFDSDIIETVQRNFYVDDLLKSVKNSEDAIKIYTQTSKLLSFGGFHLTKWISNKRDVLDAIPQSELTKYLKNIDFETEKLPVERALGMQWNVESDKFLYNINILDKPSTRRGMLSIISSIYDPLGFVSPLILRAKMLLQNLCCKKLGWDENIPAKDLIDWRKWLTELPTIEQFSIERCIKPDNFGDVTHTELHHFSDASEVGYGHRFVLSKLSWYFTTSDLSKTLIVENIDSLVSRYVRQWLEGTIRATLTSLLISKSKYGLSLILPSTKFMQCQVVIRNALKSSPNSDINHLWARASTSCNIQYDQYCNTKQVLNAVQTDNENRLHHELKSQGVIISSILLHASSKTRHLWSKVQKNMPRNIFNLP